MYTQFGHGMVSGGQRMMDGGLGFGGFGILSTVGFIIVAAAVVGLIIWALARKSTRPGAAVPGPTAADTALAIARERLARGEIDPEQYTAIATALTGPPSVPVTSG